MNKEISVNDIFKAAMQVEAVGEAFYRKYAEKTDSGDIKKTFNFLAAKEQRHYQIFKEWIEMLKPAEAEKGISPQNRGYLSKMITEVIFGENQKPENLLKRVKSMRDALQTALELENNSIGFYEKMVPEVEAEVAKGIAKIIAEEETHAQTIRGMLDNLP